MDILSDLFRDAGLRRRIVDLIDLPTGAQRDFPCDRSVGLHVVLEGSAWLHPANGAAPIRVEAGEIALMARGEHHALSPADTQCRVISGAYQLWHAPLHPVFGDLPPWNVRRGDRANRLDAIGLTVSLLADEASGDALGRETAVYALLDLLFTRVVRELVEQRGVRTPGVGHAIRDRQVRAALTLLHEDVAAEWTIDRLGASVGLSRSAFAERFRAVVGEPPLTYLRTLRVQRAMRLLAESSDGLDVIAHRVGYGDAFAFSKAFKKATGISPGEFRRRDAAERALAWRFEAREAVGGG
ncbi:MAG: AraC family transcriptional regulator [Gemmatimonadaceae bacterium]|nr:AraC family transcriptional regulator [Gemmatimonadaceae bacterium]